MSGRGMIFLFSTSVVSTCHVCHGLGFSMWVVGILQRGSSVAKNPRPLLVKLGSLNVPMGHITQPWMVYGLLDGYYKVMSNIPKMGQLPTSGEAWQFLFFLRWWYSSGHEIVKWGNSFFYQETMGASPSLDGNDFFWFVVDYQRLTMKKNIWWFQTNRDYVYPDFWDDPNWPIFLLGDGLKRPTR